MPTTSKGKKTPAYKRRLLVTLRGLQIVLIDWPKGSRSLPHDHSVGGWVIVLKGAIYERSKGCTIEWKKGQAFPETIGAVHLVGAREKARTLHIYFGKLEMQTYAESDLD